MSDRVKSVIESIAHLISLRKRELDRARDLTRDLAAVGNLNWRATEQFADLVEAEIRGLEHALRIATRAIDDNVIQYDEHGPVRTLHRD